MIHHRLPPDPQVLMEPREHALLKSGVMFDIL